jgi:methyltransferase (TIGR00027 family)
MPDDALVRNVSDTALWVAHYRAEETDRPDAVFRDPFARALAGERGEQIARSQGFDPRNAWPFTARTVIVDRCILHEVNHGVDMVVNLAAGLDTRPYRMTLPPALKWVEVDLPGILDYKERILEAAPPACAVERVRLDISNEGARRELFAQLGARAARAVILTEGLLVYLDPEEVRSLARDIRDVPRFDHWICDIANPAVVKIMMKQGAANIAAVAPFKFAPPDGPDAFKPFGWHAVEATSVLKTAARLRRVSLVFRLLALLPNRGRNPNQPWSGVCVLERTP